MSALQILRQSRALPRWVLVWFVLTIGLAVATPLVQPQTLSVICTTAGNFKVVTSGEQGSLPTSHSALDCVLCLTPGPPPPVSVHPVHTALAVGTVRMPSAVTHIAWLTASPLPARGPPSFSQA